jgi:hypothetical protein
MAIAGFLILRQSPWIGLMIETEVVAISVDSGTCCLSSRKTILDRWIVSHYFKENSLPLFATTIFLSRTPWHRQFRLD